MKNFVFGFVVAVAILIVIPLIVIAFGGVNMGASGGRVHWKTILASWTVDRSVAVSHPDEKNPHDERRGRRRRRLASLPRNVHRVPRCARNEERAEFAAGLQPTGARLSRRSKRMD